MPRQRSLPWIYRWSRPLIAGLASIGAAVTGYLTISKLTNTATECKISDCNIVLNGPYATVFGQPLALFGFLAYVSMIVFAIAPLLVNAQQNRALRTKLEDWTGLLLFAGGTAMMVFSGYLMYLIAFEIKAACVYCIASAILSASLFGLALSGREWPDLGKPLFTGLIVALLVLLSTLGIYANINSPASADSDKPSWQGPPITTASGPAEIALAKHLTQAGAKFYGAFWCPHCHDQKLLFGKEAISSVPYVECSNPERTATMPVCTENKIQSFPTWIIKDQTLSGTQSLEKLAQVSGYTGARNFKNALPGKPVAP
jgi:uncharacterized membrane protein